MSSYDEAPLPNNDSITELGSGASSIRCETPPNDPRGAQKHGNETAHFDRRGGPFDSPRSYDEENPRENEPSARRSKRGALFGPPSGPPTGPPLRGGGPPGHGGPPGGGPPGGGPPGMVGQLEEKSKAQIAVIMFALCMAVFLAALDITIITTALPTISEHFHSSSGYIWIGSSFLLGNSASTPIWGKISDIFGRKIILLIANVIFLVGSLLAATSVNIEMMITARTVQGIGAGGLVTMVNICIGDLFSMRNRGQYYGIIGGVWAIASSLGPILGGLFTEYAGWRWCFYINLPLDGAAFLIILLFLDIKQTKSPFWEGIKAIDWLGAFLVTGGTLMLLFGLEFGGVQYPWKSGMVIGLIAGGIITIGLFLVNEWKLAKYPITPIRIFKYRSNLASLGVCFIHGFVFIAASYYLPLYFQAVRGASPLMSGVYLLPNVLALSLMSATTGVFIKKTGQYLPPIWFGMFVMTVGYGLMIDLRANSSWAKIIAYQIVVGIGVGPNFQSPLIALQSKIEPRDIGTATAAFGFMRNLATAISVVIGGVVFQTEMQQRRSTLISAVGPGIAQELGGDNAGANVGRVNALPPAQRTVIRTAFADSIRVLWMIYTGFAGLGLLIAFLITRQTLSRQHQETKTGLEQQKIEREMDLERKRESKRLSALSAMEKKRGSKAVMEERKRDSGHPEPAPGIRGGEVGVLAAATEAGRAEHQRAQSWQPEIAEERKRAKQYEEELRRRSRQLEIEMRRRSWQLDMEMKAESERRRAALQTEMDRKKEAMEQELERLRTSTDVDPASAAATPSRRRSNRLSRKRWSGTSQTRAEGDTTNNPGPDGEGTRLVVPAMTELSPRGYAAPEPSPRGKPPLSAESQRYSSSVSTPHGAPSPYDQPSPYGHPSTGSQPSPYGTGDAKYKENGHIDPTRPYSVAVVSSCEQCSPDHRRSRSNSYTKKTIAPMNNSRHSHSRAQSETRYHTDSTGESIAIEEQRPIIDHSRSSYDQPHAGTDSNYRPMVHSRQSSVDRPHPANRTRASLDGQGSRHPSLERERDRGRPTLDQRRMSVDRGQSSVEARRTSNDRHSSSDRARSSVDHRRTSVDRRRTSTDRGPASVERGRSSRNTRRTSVDYHRSSDSENALSPGEAAPAYQERPDTTINHSTSTPRGESSRRRGESSTRYRGESSTRRRRSSSVSRGKQPAHDI